MSFKYINLNNLFKNKSFYLMNFMIFNSILSMFLSNFIQLWIIMEINTMLMIILLSIYSINKKIPINYFIIQSISSLSLIYMIIMFNYFNNSMLLSSMIMLFFFMKLNLFPFFFWLPLINLNLNWILIFFMSTTQKLLPLILMNMFFNQLNNIFFLYLIFSTSIFSSMTSVIMSINENNLIKIFTFSSMNHSAWMIFIITIDLSLFILYFLIYSISMMFICLFFNKIKISNFNQLYNILFLNKFIFNPILINILIISSLPPFLTFLIKIKSINLMLINSNNLIMLILMILSILTLIFYMNILIKIKMIQLIKLKFNSTYNFQIKNSFLSLLFFIFLTLTIILIIIII
nr:NADH dehydrogenase subunit 2 [Polistes riparius]